MYPLGRWGKGLRVLGLVRGSRKDEGRTPCCPRRTGAPDAGAPLDVWAAVPAKSVFGNFGVVRIGGAVLVRKAPVSRSRLVADLSPAVPGFLRR